MIEAEFVGPHSAFDPRCHLPVIAVAYPVSRNARGSVIVSGEYTRPFCAAVTPKRLA